MAKRKSLLVKALLALVAATTAVGPAAAAVDEDATAAAMKTWDSGDPTPQEQYVLEVINRARKDPLAEGKRLSLDVAEGLDAKLVPLIGPRPPLAMNPLLLKAARGHDEDMSTRSYFAHVDPDGKGPFDRIKDAGYAFSTAGENIAAGSAHDAVELEDELMIDAKTPGRGHRINLLSIMNPPYCREIGIASFAAENANSMRLADFLTQDFGCATDNKPFILGVVYHDDNGNGMCDPGEGYPGVLVYPDSGDYKAITGKAGGYAFPIDPGVHTITFSFGVHGVVIKTVTVGDDNVQVDALTSEARKRKKPPKNL